MTASVLLPVTAPDGIVGQRQLTVVQTVDIARLTTHPVPIVAGQFVAVGGRGPKGDSNESGKTSFLAATSLLLGDSEWRPTAQGGAGAAALLFEPEIAGVTGQRYAPARHGYVIGVFSDTEAPQARPLTVWMRISATSPYLLVRWQEGVALSNSRDLRDIDAFWDAMGSRNEAGAHKYVERLYGDVPRCLAYVSRRGKVQSRASLLQMNAGAFTPKDIAQNLIALTGKSTVYENEAETRERLYRQQLTLEQRQQEQLRAVEREERELEDVHSREQARAYFKEALVKWELHCAAGLVEALGRQKVLEQELADLHEEGEPHRHEVAAAEAELARLSDDDGLRSAAREAELHFEGLRQQERELQRREDTLRERVKGSRQRQVELRDETQDWNGQSADAARAALDRAREALERISETVTLATREREEAERHLADVRAGGDEFVVDCIHQLRRAGVDAVGLLNGVELDPSARDFWEPRLLLYADAVAVPARQRIDALNILSTIPGAVLVCGENQALPHGVLAAPEGSAALLHELQHRMSVDPQRSAMAIDVVAGVHVIGGHPLPMVGEQARITTATAALDRAVSAEGSARAAYESAWRQHEAAESDVRMAEAVVELAVVDADIRRYDDGLAALTPEYEQLAPRLREADTARVTALAELQTLEKTKAAFRSRKESVLVLVQESERREDDVRSKIGQLRVEYWKRGWVRSVDDAYAALVAERKDARTYSNEASELLNNALMTVGMGTDPEKVPVPALVDIVRRRGAVVRGEDTERAQFVEFVQPLQDWLNEYSERDVMLAERIDRERKRRDDELRLVTRECADLEQELTQLQDAIQERIQQSLNEVAREFDRLDRENAGFGATIEVVARRPTLPTDEWTWEATPKWKRSASGAMLSYAYQTNTAQEKQHTVHLVLAALLASPNARGRVLILDELGDSLGVAHRREVLESIAACARSHNFTVLGTCQDAVLQDAARFCGQILYFEYAAKNDALNRPTRAFGFDANKERVELTVEHVIRGREWQ